MKPAHFELATELIGLKEFPGKSKDNPTIMDMYADLGHAWVEHDETPWCAAFVGAMLEEAGIRSTRKLNARSYLKWGVKVARPRIGDVVIFKRGNSSWQGHVAFYAGETEGYIRCLGGNQSDSVKISRYRKSKLLGIRRAVTVEPKKPTVVVPKEDRQPIANSRTLQGTAISFLSALGAVFLSAWDGIKKIIEASQGPLEVFQNMVGDIKFDGTTMLILLGLSGLVLSAYARMDANAKGKIG